ncbi:trypsin-like peptidase domain-containing protein [Streptomyces sp. TRM68416]|uniref:VMAP-C domain-containing protein n=1 Tax=Streptomyces sp. TRM68416 TaxID=2758412 RepID=UPI0016618D54|nr:trypsin-like peptidase domain-containing protein [Streptomyces sp. TRM68416]MBD0843553.1 trypsin-like peptidase domain-containing protein [Streptomyces sp. TRM68416]
MSERHERLYELVRAATVHLLPAGGKDGPLWGSGFFVAPGWVVTAAHVLRRHLAADRDAVFRVRGEGIDAEARLAEWLITDPHRPKVPLAEDLALVRLTGDPDEHPHECVWLTDRAARNSGALKACGYFPGPPEAHFRMVDAVVNGQEDTHGLIIKPDVEFTGGMSGGPLLDPETGAVVGLIKSRRTDKDGGKAVAIGALRRFGETYRTVMAAHDRWHGQEPMSESGDNWIDLQGGPPAEHGAVWTPRDRRTALALLAALPPPPDEPTVRIIAKEARSGTVWVGGTPELRTWRDGHGLLYEGSTPLDPLTFLRYLTLVEAHARTRDAGSPALVDWIAQRLRRDGRRHLHALVKDAALPEGLEPPARNDGPDRVVIPYPGPGEGPVVALVLDPVIGARPVRFFWQIWYDDGDGLPELHETDGSVHGYRPDELVQALRLPLGGLLESKDRHGHPVPLEVALPVDHFDTAVHRWRFDDIAQLNDPGHLGARRRVVLRALERRGEPDNLWTERWHGMTAGRRFQGWRMPPSGAVDGTGYRRAERDRIPMMCRPAGQGIGRVAMNHALAGGHGVALWYIGSHPERGCLPECDTLHARVEKFLETLGSLDELPDRLRHVRQDISEQRADSDWAEPLALLFDDPRRPLPGEETEPVDAPL